MRKISTYVPKSKYFNVNSLTSTCSRKTFWDVPGFSIRTYLVMDGSDDFPVHLSHIWTRQTLDTLTYLKYFNVTLVLFQVESNATSRTAKPSHLKWHPCCWISYKHLSVMDGSEYFIPTWISKVATIFKFRWNSMIRKILREIVLLPKNVSLRSKYFLLWLFAWFILFPRKACFCRPRRRWRMFRSKLPQMALKRDRAELLWHVILSPTTSPFSIDLKVPLLTEFAVDILLGLLSDFQTLWGAHQLLHCCYSKGKFLSFTRNWLVQ